MIIAERLQLVQQKIKEASLKQQSRQMKSTLSDGVRLITVTKNQDFASIQKVIDLGQTVIGENRVQELLKKYEHFGQKLEYHLIGHLQTNKVKFVVPICSLIQSLDSLKLAEEIQKVAINYNKVQNVLLQVNVAEEESKFGVHLSEVQTMVEALQQFPNINLQGFMTVAPFSEEIETLRPIFRALYDQFCYVKENLELKDFRYLSMGMSNDYTVAIEEGANLVRVGTAIFGPRDYTKKL